MIKSVIYSNQEAVFRYLREARVENLIPLTPTIANY